LKVARKQFKKEYKLLKKISNLHRESEITKKEVRADRVFWSISDEKFEEVYSIYEHVN
jgi:hypothetical protein